MVENNQNFNLEEELEGAGDLFTNEDGELRVDGTVFVGSIQHRGKNTKVKVDSKKGKAPTISNVVKPVGYKITNVKNEAKFLEKKALLKEVKLGQAQVDDVEALEQEVKELKEASWVFMEKMEAIDLVRQLGVVNATIRPRRQNVKDDQGNIVSTKINLNLHPIKKERPFTDADRLYPVFKLDKNGKIVKPTELLIKEENCTELLWEVVEEAYKNRKPSGNSKTYRRISREEKLSRIEQAMEAANFKGAENPFNRKR